MSTLEVNSIQPLSSGNTITLGASGKTLSIPSGCTITNSGTATGFGGGKINQHVSSQFTSGSSTSSSGTFVDSPVTLNITPTASSSKILIMFNLTIYKTGGDNEIDVRILRDIGGTTTKTVETGSIATSNSNDHYDTLGVTTNDSPNTTSQITYTVQFRRTAGSGTVATSISDSKRAEMTLMEVLA
jgi:hypothetical protein